MKMQKGFTLIELLVSVSILAIISTMILGSFTNAQKQARDTQRKSDLKVVREGLEQYKIDTGSYPITATPATLTNAKYTTMTGTLGTTYLKAVPIDPRNTATPFQYLYGSDGTTYKLRACLENKTDTSGVWVNTYCGNTTGNNTTGYPSYTVTEP